MPAGEVARVRLAELIASLSLATDLGMGQPLEKAMRGCLMAMRLSTLLGCDDAMRHDVYYLSLLIHIGCTAHAHEFAGYVGGDEIGFRTRSLAPAWPASPPSVVMRDIVRHLGEDRALPTRSGLVLGMLRSGRQRSAYVAAAQCEAATCLARLMHLPEGVTIALGQTLERWDGKGAPAGLEGDSLAMPVRIVHVAHDAEIFQRFGGRDACVDAIRHRQGAGYDPAVAEAFLAATEEILDAAPEAEVWEAALDAEPQPWVSIPEAQLNLMARAFAEFVDLKSPFTTGHSGGVADLVAGAAEGLGLAAAERTTLQRAALLHDLGRVAVPNGIWDKPGRLGVTEVERVRLHPYYTERILNRSALLDEYAALAGAHHERIDSSGYHRGSSSAQLTLSARVLAASDAYQAMQQERPHRPALSAEAAAAELREEVTAGRLDRRAADAVLEAAGHAAGRQRREHPAGLSDREVEVLGLICLGLTNRQMGHRLHIAEKTVGHHVEHIYNKIGRATRPGAALFAMEHGLAGTAPL